MDSWEVKSIDLVVLFVNDFLALHLFSYPFLSTVSHMLLNYLVHVHGHRHRHRHRPWCYLAVREHLQGQSREWLWYDLAPLRCRIQLETLLQGCGSHHLGFHFGGL